MAKRKRRTKLPRRDSSSTSAARRPSAPPSDKADALANEKRIAFVAFVILVAAATAMGVVAKNSLSGAGAAARAAAQPQGGGLTLAKEYIYGPGGKILATEEPASGGSSPHIDQINPNSAGRNQLITVTITGSNLSGASSVNFSPAADITATITGSAPNTVTADVQVGQFAATGPRNVSVTVGPATSNPLQFTIGNPPPTISSISPTTAVAGGAQFDLTVLGTGFIANVSVAQVDGSPRVTMVNSQTQLTVQIPATDIAVAGLRQITVSNPGAGVSNPRSLTVEGGSLNPIPHIGSISPSTLPVGSPNLQLVVTSNNGSFRQNAVVTVDGSPRQTSFQSVNQVTATLLAADVAAVGLRVIQVVNPGPGGGVSDNIFALTIGTIVTGTGLRGEYFANATLQGSPAFSRVDPTVDFNWGNGSPGAGVPADQFSVRWTGKVKSIGAGTYRFFVVANDGVKLWVNNQLLVNRWTTGSVAVESSGTIKLFSNQQVDIRMEFFDNTGPAEAHLLWSTTAIPKQVIPQSQLFPSPGGPAPPPVLLEGVHEVTNCSTISGWAADRNQPNSAITVDIYNGESLLQTVTANQPRTGLPVAGNHGFTFTVPASLKDGQPHTIGVRFGGAQSLLTNSPQTLTCSGTATPAAPSGLVATMASATQVNLSWLDNSSNEDQFRIERQDPSQSYQEIASRPANVVTYSDLGRTPGATYNYRVRACNQGGGCSAYSSVVSITIPGSPGGAPTQPTNLTATAVSSSQINLTWSDSSLEVGYVIYARKLPTTKATAVASVEANVTSFSHRTLFAQSTYCYQVEAHNSEGRRRSVEVCATTTSGPKALPTVSMLSGDGEAGSFGYVEGAPGSAKWKAPVAGVTGIDPVSGSMALFVVDTTSNRIRMVYLDGPAAGTSILIAGSGAAGYSEGEGDPFAARYNNPQGITAVKNDEGVVDALIIADTDNHLIRMLLAPLGGDRWRPEYLSGKEGSADYGDGPPNDTIFNTPVGITVGNDDNIYVADSLNGAIRRLDWSGNSSTFYISGVFTPKGVTPSGSHWLYVTSHSGHWINRVTAGTREVMSGSFPGFSDGPGLGSKYNNPFHLVWADTGGDGSLFIADTNNTRIRQYDLAGMLVSTYAGTADAGYKNDISTSALFNGPKGIAIGPSNEIYIVEVSNNGIRTVKEE